MRNIVTILFLILLSFVFTLRLNKANLNASKTVKKEASKINNSNVNAEGSLTCENNEANCVPAPAYLPQDNN